MICCSTDLDCGAAARPPMSMGRSTAGGSVARLAAESRIIGRSNLFAGCSKRDQKGGTRKSSLKSKIRSKFIIRNSNFAS